MLHATTRLLLLAALLCLALAHPGGQPQHHGEGSHPEKPTVFMFTDVNTDDVQALKMLLKFDNINVGGVTADCGGFCNMGPAIQNLFGLLAFMNRNDIPVWAGEAYSSDEIDSGQYGCFFSHSIPEFPKGRIWGDTVCGLNNRYPRLPDSRNYYPNFTQVYQPITEAINALTGPVWFLSTGAMTTIDFLFRQQPQLKSRVERIWVMGGAVDVAGNLFWPKNFVANTYAEYNIYSAPYAAQAVFQSGVPITLVPLDATNAFQLTYPWLNQFNSVAKTPEAHFCHDLLFTIKNHSSSTSMYSLWDPLTAAIMANSSLIVSQKTLNITVVLDASTDQVGRLVVDNVEGAPIDVVFVADQYFYQLFIDKLNAPRYWEELGWPQ